MTSPRDSVPIRGVSLSLPTFFPSVSSLKTARSPAAYIELLSELHTSQFLISAYDYQADSADRQRIDRALARSEKDGTIVLLDSGNYEAFWYRDADWAIDGFEACAQSIRPSLAFSFDLQNPPTDMAEHVRAVVDLSERSQAILAQTTIIPIVHGSREDLPALVKAVATQLRPLMVAVPERALGDGILTRIRTVFQIRAALGILETPLHILGTGDPISIAAYVASGADSFDGLEWCQIIAREADATLHHFSHFDLVGPPEDVGLTDDYVANGLLHNLAFFWRWMQTVRAHREAGDLPSFVLNHLSKAAAQAMTMRIPEVFEQ